MATVRDGNMRAAEEAEAADAQGRRGAGAGPGASFSSDATAADPPRRSPPPKSASSRPSILRRPLAAQGGCEHAPGVDDGWCFLCLVGQTPADRVGSSATLRAGSSDVLRASEVARDGRKVSFSPVLMMGAGFTDDEECGGAMSAPDEEGEEEGSECSLDGSDGAEMCGPVPDPVPAHAAGDDPRAAARGPLVPAAGTGDGDGLPDLRTFWRKRAPPDKGGEGGRGPEGRQAGKPGPFDFLSGLGDGSG